MMQTVSQPTPQGNKMQQAEAAFRQLIADALRSGFHGTAGLTLSIQDGHIQYIHLAIERMIK